jgi:hypothetical protein
VSKIYFFLVRRVRYVQKIVRVCGTQPVGVLIFVDFHYGLSWVGHKYRLPFFSGVDGWRNAGVIDLVALIAKESFEILSGDEVPRGWPALLLVGTDVQGQAMLGQ